MWDQLKTVNDLIVLQKCGTKWKPATVLFSTLSTLANLTLIYKNCSLPIQSQSHLFFMRTMCLQRFLNMINHIFWAHLQLCIDCPYNPKKKPRPYVNGFLLGCYDHNSLTEREPLTSIIILDANCSITKSQFTLECLSLRSQIYFRISKVQKVVSLGL